MSTEVRLQSPPISTVPKEPRSGKSREERVLIVGKGVVITANVTACDKVVVEGQFEGNVKAAEFVLTEGGYMKGEVSCAEARVGGKMDGTIVASKTLILKSKADVTGDMTYENLEIEDGGKLQGKLMRFTPSSETRPVNGKGIEVKEGKQTSKRGESGDIKKSERIIKGGEAKESTQIYDSGKNGEQKDEHVFFRH